MVRRELWTSFRSLLQAYLAAGSMGAEVAQALVVAGSDQEAVRGQIPATLDLVGITNTVRLAFHLSNGEGYWAVFGSADKNSQQGNEIPLDEGQFRIGLDSLFTWSGKQGQLEMDAIAEALVMLVLEPGS
jgi:hypothetical protein